MPHFKSISVLGCGWLGLPLASRFVELGVHVKGSTTTPASIEIIKSAGIKPYHLVFNPSLESSPGDFFASDILFLNIPFRRNLVDPQFYQEQISNAADAFVAAGGGWLIFASSTLVYPNQIGLGDASAPQEDQLLVPEGEREKLLYAIERQLLADGRFDTTVIRFGGLFGPGRQLKDFIGRAIAKDGDSRVNLIHLDDCVGLVEALVAKGVRHQVFNAVSDDHPTRQALYSSIARDAGLPIPVFSSGSGIGKIVSNAKAKAVLEYRFKFPTIK